MCWVFNCLKQWLCFLFQVHEFDNCRFDVNVGDCVYYLRATDAEERQNWVDILEAAKVQ